MDNKKRCFRLRREAGDFRVVSILTFFCFYFLFFGGNEGNCAKRY